MLRRLAERRREVDPHPVRAGEHVRAQAHHGRILGRTDAIDHLGERAAVQGQQSVAGDGGECRRESFPFVRRHVGNQQAKAVLVGQPVELLHHLHGHGLIGMIGPKADQIGAAGSQRPRGEIGPIA